MQEIEAQKISDIKISWSKAAEIQGENGKASPGFAGPVNGTSHGVFLTAGGANFPGKLPWEGGEKRYYSEVHVFRLSKDHLLPVENKQHLPQAVAYSGSTTTPIGIVYAGGENESGILKNSWLLSWDSSAQKINTSPLPDLPKPLTNLSLAAVDYLVYAAGGDMQSATSQSFFVLDLNASQANMEWRSLPDLPLPLANAALISLQKKLYLIGGRTKTASGISELHNTVFSFDPVNEKWQQHGFIMNGREATNLSAAAGVAIKDQYILMIGGDDGRVFHEIETLISKISKADDGQEKQRLITEKTALQNNHQGFNRSLLLYDLAKDKWRKIGEYPFPTQVTTTAVKYNDVIVISNGEIKPGIRTPAIFLGKIRN